MTTADTKLAPESLDSLLGYNLKRAYILVQADFRAAMEDEDLTARAFTALSLVAAHPGISQSDLARRMGVERSGLVAIVDGLEGRGYVGRAAVPGDRRVQALSVTEAGAAAHARATQKVRAHEARFFAEFSEEERRALLTLLGRIRAAHEG